jgi:hypothetical protein
MVNTREYDVDELTESEKNTIINALVFISKGLSVEQRDEFNHVANIVEKLKASKAEIQNG